MGFYYPAASFSSGFALTQNNLVGTIGLLPSKYSIVFDLFPSTAQTGWRSIVDLTAGGGEGNGVCNGAGCRLPSIQFCGECGSASMSLYVSHVSSGSGWTNEVILRDGPQLPLNAWSTITVTVDSVGLQLTLTAVTTSTGDTIIPLQSVSFATPQQLTWSNVQVYASDPWYTVADAKIRNLLIDVGIYTPQRL